MRILDKVSVALAQINPGIGRLDENLDKHLDFIHQAKQKNANIIVFPELSMTGYLLRDKVSDVARKFTDAWFQPILEQSNDITILLGAVELSDDFKIFNSCFVFEDGKHIHTHRKIYLPTYNVFDEKRYFAEGNRVRAFQSKYGKFGILICNDMWHPSLLWLLSLQGCDAVFVPAAAPLRGLMENKISDSQRIWNLLCESGSKTNTLYVAFVNLIGWHDQLYFFGGSTMYGPNGTNLEPSPSENEKLLLLEVDYNQLKRERIVTPLRRDERVDLVARELHIIRTSI